MTLHRLLAGLGRVLIAAGVLVLLFVVYTLWGTGLRTAQAQDRLGRELDAVLAQASAGGTAGSSPEAPDPTGTGTGNGPTAPPETVDPADLPPPADGDPLGRISIGSIGVDWVYTEGVSLRQLDQGPGHFPTTPFPGQPGNAAIAGHRVTYGAPFHRLDELAAGDTVQVTTPQGEFHYEILPQDPAYEGAPPRAHFIVKPGDTWILDPSEENLLTLMACHPKYSAAERIVVVGRLVGPPGAPTPPSVADDGTEHTLPDEMLTNEPGALPPAIAWSALALAVWAAVWLVARRWPAWRSVRWWATYLVGLVPFTVVLYLSFEAIARLLPAGY